MSPPNLSIILVMLCFWLTLWLVSRFLIKPVTAVLDQRNGRIDGADRAWTATNEEMLSATARIEEEISEAARDAASARTEVRSKALNEKQQRIDEARRDGEARLSQALEDLGRDAERARSELRTRGDELGRSLAVRLLGREVRS